MNSCIALLNHVWRAKHYGHGHQTQLSKMSSAGATANATCAPCPAGTYSIGIGNSLSGAQHPTLTRNSPPQHLCARTDALSLQPSIYYTFWRWSDLRSSSKGRQARSVTMDGSSGIRIEIKGMIFRPRTELSENGNVQPWRLTYLHWIHSPRDLYDAGATANATCSLCPAGTYSIGSGDLYHTHYLLHYHDNNKGKLTTPIMVEFMLEIWYLRDWINWPCIWDTLNHSSWW